MQIRTIRTENQTIWIRIWTIRMEIRTIRRERPGTHCLHMCEISQALSCWSCSRQSHYIQVVYEGSKVFNMRCSGASGLIVTTLKWQKLWWEWERKS